jgi:hypothetical protein
LDFTSKILSRNSIVNVPASEITLWMKIRLIGKATTRINMRAGTPMNRCPVPIFLPFVILLKLNISLNDILGLKILHLENYSPTLQILF